MTIDQKVKTLMQLHKAFWKIFSEYSRRKFTDRNGYVACCSCGTIHHWRNLDCGHYINRTHLYTRYLDMNNNPQCKNCNAFKQGNAVGYREFLVNKYGEKAIRTMEDRRKFPASFTREGLQLKIDEYKKKLENLEKRKV